MSEPLDVMISKRLGDAGPPDAPALGLGEVGLRIAAANLRYDADEEELRLDLFVSYAFPMTLWRAYKRLQWAIHVTFEDVETGRGGAVFLKDPFLRYADDDGDNFVGLPPPDPSPAVQGASVRVPLRVRTRRGARQPSLYVKATLREHTSNTLSLDLENLTVVGA